MKKIINLYICYFKINIKRLVIYKADFIFNLLSVSIWIIAGIFNITILFNNVNTLSDWTYNEVGLLYGMWSLTFSIYNFFGNGILDIEENIISGKLDTLLLKPTGTLFQIVCSRVNTMGLGFMFVGIMLVSIFSARCSIDWSLCLFVYLIVATLSGGLLIFGTYLILGSLAFWILRSSAAIKIGYDIHKFAQYPISIYGITIKIILMLILPYAFTNFYPVAVLLGKQDFIWGLLSLLVCYVVFIISIWIWRCGLKKYEGAGT